MKLNEEFVRAAAFNPAAFSNAQKISRKNGFTVLNATEDGELIFGECQGSGSEPYRTSVDFSGDSPVYRCSCPSRQFPCKHCLAIMLDYVAGKTFTAAEAPDDIKQKREKLAKKAEKAASGEKTVPKQNKAAAEKRLKKQAEGLELAQQFVDDILTRGVSSINSASASQYRELAKQLGSYWLPEPQTVITEIVNSAEALSENPDDAEINRLVRLCVKLNSVVKKSRDYISSKLESGEVLPEDSVLYEAMGGVWKLTQLKEIGLYKENARIIQLSFDVLDDTLHAAYVDMGYWLDLDSGVISKTENIRPYKALKHVTEQDSVNGVHSIKELYSYPGGLNRRIRWETAEISDTTSEICAQMLSKAESGIGDALKKAKNELKNTLSDSTAAMLIPFDSLTTGKSGLRAWCKGESICLAPTPDHPRVCKALELSGTARGALFGELFYDPEQMRILMCPLSIVTKNGIIRLSGIKR